MRKIINDEENENVHDDDVHDDDDDDDSQNSKPSHFVSELKAWGR